MPLDPSDPTKQRTFVPLKPANVQADGKVKSALGGVICPGCIDRVSRGGKTLLRAQISAETPLSGKDQRRAEIAYLPEPFQVFRTYRFDMIIPKAYFSYAPVSIMQFHGSEDVEDQAIRPPCLSVTIRGNLVVTALRADRRRATLITPSEKIIAAWPWQGDRLDTIEITANWSFDETGMIEVRRNGNLISTNVGPNCYNDSKGPYPKIGIYRWDSYLPNEGPQIVYFSELSAL